MRRGFVDRRRRRRAGMSRPAPPHALDTEVESFDGTHITTHFYPARRPRGRRQGADDPDRPRLGRHRRSRRRLPRAVHRRRLQRRHLGRPRASAPPSGIVMIDHPKFEAKDVSALIDFVAEQPEAQLDKPGDPRVGMSGGSYGGGIQFITAARDKRVDVIAPTIPWHNLLESLYPRQVGQGGLGPGADRSGHPHRDGPAGHLRPRRHPETGRPVGPLLQHRRRAASRPARSLTPRSPGSTSTGPTSFSRSSTSRS